MTELKTIENTETALEKANFLLWRVVDLVTAGSLIIEHAMVVHKDDPIIKGLDGILLSIGTLADLANVSIIEAMGETHEVAQVNHA